MARTTLDTIQAYRASAETLALAALAMAKDGKPHAERYAELAAIMSEEYEQLIQRLDAVPVFKQKHGDNVIMFPVIKR